MRGQLAHLLEVAELPNFKVQVLPRSVVPPRAAWLLHDHVVPDSG